MKNVFYPYNVCSKDFPNTEQLVRASLIHKGFTDWKIEKAKEDKTSYSFYDKDITNTIIAEVIRKNKQIDTDNGNKHEHVAVLLNAESLKKRVLANITSNKKI